MATPLDAVTAIHNAFRRDIANIDAAALEEVAPSVAEAYLRDHRGLDAARATAAFKFHLDIHLDKEAPHLADGDACRGICGSRATHPEGGRRTG